MSTFNLTTLVRLFAAKHTVLPTSTKHPLWAWVGTAINTAPTAGEPVIATHATPEGTALVVLCADQPFLIDTILMVLRAQGAEPIACSHPLVQTIRKGKTLQSATIARGKAQGAESWLVAILPTLTAPQCAALQKALQHHLAQAHAAVADFDAMRTQLHTATQTLLADAAYAEEKRFCTWLADNHFVLMGYRHYRTSGSGKTLALQATAGSALGVLRNQTSAASQPTPLSALGNLKKYYETQGPLVLAKTPNNAPIHRNTPMDYVGLLERNAKGDVIAEHRFLGLYTSSAYTEGVRTMPLLRKKVQALASLVRKQQRWSETSHHARVLQNVLETWPRDELLLAEPETLAPMLATAVGLRAHPDTALLLRPAARENAATALVYLPLARMNTQLRTTIGEALNAAVGTVRTFKVELGDDTHAEAGLARLTFRCDWDGRAVDEAALNTRIRALVRGWEDEIMETLGHVPNILAHASAAYRAQTSATQAVADAKIAENISAPCATVQTLPENRLALRFYSPKPLSLVQTVMLLEGCGLQPTHEEAHTLGQAHIHVLYVQNTVALTQAQQTALAATLNACVQGGAEEDSLNRLAITITATPTDMLLLRALVAYAQQLHRVMEPRRTRHALWQNPAMAQSLVALFHAKLNPAAKPSERSKAKALQTSLETAIQKLPSAEDEHLWRTLLGIVTASLRTNLYTLKANEALAIKVNPAAIGTVAAPHPWREIFVYHPAVEGVHLRGGPVARGGLRNSNRGADYRTEVLGLMTAQVRKNTIIVPVGAKGGFYVRQTAPEGTTPKAWAEFNYRRYIRALLSITDNRTPKGETIAPLGVRCLDDADPYLVVAADKGTATYSDFANAESQAADYWGPAHKGFWLDDAFASGGKTGYDHKALAITARGAWVSVLHHAGSLGITPSPKRALSLTGIGDMAGDVFGNGLLRSPYVHLVAAFNHSHIFIDPTPDAAKTFAERERSFNAGLGWDGYDTKILSKGGGIYLRSAKTITISPEAQKALGAKGQTFTPDALIQTILAAPVDVLWNGGIGTYIKASDEPHAAAQDKANDTTRIDAKAFRAKIIGEGGNLGLTPRARVELAKRGVALNTDALDNSAGVDTSDHEVNLKILCALAEQKKLLTRAERDVFLKKLTDEVCTLVLRDNAAQNLLISLEAAAHPDDHAELATWQETLIKAGIADPALDCLPTRKDVLARENGRYTRPELAALVAASKAWVRRALLTDTALLQSQAAAPLLQWYFPHAVQKKFGALIPQHPLANEITATVLANLIINRLGLLAIPRLMTDFSATPTDAARALAVGCCVARLTGLWRQLDELQESATPLATPAQVAAYRRLKLVATFLGAWLLRQGQPVNMEKLWATYFEPLQQGIALLPKALKKRPEVLNWQAEWAAQGLPEALAQRMALLSPLVVLPDAVLAAKVQKANLAEVLAVHLHVGSALMLPALIGKIRAMPTPDTFTRQAVQALVLEIFTRQRRLSEYLLHKGMSVEAWLGDCGPVCGQYQLLVRQLLREKHMTVAMLTLVLGKLRELER